MAIRSWQAVLTTVAISFGSMPSTLATELEARSTYNNKMTLIGVLREGARQRAVEVGDLQTLCLILGSVWMSPTVIWTRPLTQEDCASGVNACRPISTPFSRE